MVYHHFRFFLLLLLAGLIYTGCITTNDEHQNAQDTRSDSIPVQEHSVQAVLWQQHAAEYRALAYQAFNLAKYRLQDILQKTDQHDTSLAIITDIDETVLDNSRFNAKLIEDDEEYSKERWIKWAKEIIAQPIPGSQEFFKYVNEKDVEIFYISNRFKSNKAATVKNLRKYDYPNADSAHIFLKDTTSGKQPRRNKAMANHTILLLLGDNLGDFHHAFDDRSTEKRNSLVDSMKQKFGKKFIAFPNPMYGAWETDGIYEGKYDWTPAEKDSLRKAKLESY